MSTETIVLKYFTGLILAKKCTHLKFIRYIAGVVLKYFQGVRQSLNHALQDDFEMKGLWGKTQTEEAVKNFVEAVTKVCWKMVIQRPLMQFKTSDKYNGETFQELTWNSLITDTDNHIVLTVYPMLYQGNRLMAKGKVLLQNPN